MAAKARNNLELYDDVAHQWWSGDVRWIRTLKNMVPGRLGYFDTFIDWQDKSVLDLVCAGGFLSEALNARGAMVTGIDPAKDAIAAARAHAHETNQNITYDVGAGEALPYANEQFDAVACVDVLEHVQDLQQVLNEVARVLKPGGFFFFDTINRNVIARLAVITMAEDVLRLLPKGTHDPTMFVKPNELKSALEKSGFDVGPMTGLGPRGVNRRLDPTFGRLPLKTVIYMGTAKKRCPPEVSN